MTPIQAAHALRLMLNRTGAAAAIGISLGERNTNNYHSER